MWTGSSATGPGVLLFEESILTMFEGSEVESVLAVPWSGGCVISWDEYRGDGRGGCEVSSLSTNRRVLVKMRKSWGSSYVAGG
jgi:hypothetical protein